MPEPKLPPPRKEALSVAPCPHGGFLEEEAEERGIPPKGVVDFSLSINPLGPPPFARRAMAQAPLSRYPDPDSSLLKRAIARKWGLAEGNVICGNGSTEILWMLGLAYLRPGDVVLVVGPTFGEYERMARLFGASVVPYRAREEDDFRPNLEEVRRQIKEFKPKLVFVCNPNNPTGVLLSRREVEGLAEECEARGALLVMDEAYRELSERAYPTEDLPLHRPVLLLRSLTKAWGIPGVRLGYGLGPEGVIRALSGVKPPWNVSAVAQAVGLAALGPEGEEFVKRGREVVAKAKSFLEGALRNLGLKVIPSEANFLLVRVEDASAFRERLLREGFAVRDCSSFGLPQYVRLGVRKLSECRRLVPAIRKVLKGGEPGIQPGSSHSPT